MVKVIYESSYIKLSKGVVGDMSFFITNLIDYLEGRLNWARRSSLWPLTFGIMCCAIEMMAAGIGRFDTERFGMIYRPSPRQADVLIINGPVSHKMAPRLRQLWDQIPNPKWAIAMGECASVGGPYWESYSIIGGADEIIPIDIYIPGCPVRPEGLIYAVTKLQEKVAKGRKWKTPEKPELTKQEQNLVWGVEPNQWKKMDRVQLDENGEILKDDEGNEVKVPPARPRPEYYVKTTKA